MSSRQQKGKNYTLVAAIVFVALFAVIGGNRLLNNSSADSLGQLLSSASSIGLDVNVVQTQQYQVDSSTQQKRVSVALNIDNNSAQVLQISPGLQMQLIDDQGNSHPMTAKYISAGQVVGGPLAAGQNWTDSIDFDLPAERTPSKLIYQPESASWPIQLDL